MELAQGAVTLKTDRVKTRPFAFRLTEDIAAIIERRAKRKCLKVGEYLRRKTEYDVRRPH